MAWGAVYHSQFLFRKPTPTRDTPTRQFSSLQAMKKSIIVKCQKRERGEGGREGNREGGEGRGRGRKYWRVRQGGREEEREWKGRREGKREGG